MPEIEAASVQLLITFDGQQCNVQGPINNKQLCYGMLELAKDAIKDYNDKAQADQRVVPATYVPNIGGRHQ